MNGGGWVPCVASWWEATAAALQASGQPWPEEAVLMDLRWWADQEEHGGAKRPGRVELARRWNWAAGERMRRVMRSEEAWADPLAAERDRNTTGTPPEHPATDERHESSENGTGPERDRNGTSPTRDPLHPTPTPITSLTIGLPASPPDDRAGGASDPQEDDDLPQPKGRPAAAPPRLDLSGTWDRIVAIRGGKPLSLTEARKRLLRSAMREVGVEGALLIASWVVRGTDQRAAFLRDRRLDSPDTYLRPSHLGEYHDLARAWDAAGRQEDPPSPPPRMAPVPIEDWRARRDREARDRVERMRAVRRDAGLDTDEPHAAAGGA